MEFIRRNSDYALRCLGRMSRLARGETAKVDDIAAREGVPSAFLRKIFQKLVDAGLIASKKGRGGGFYLVRRAEDLNLKEILEAVQGRISMSDCVSDPKSCARSRRCSTRRGIANVERRFVDLLSGYTLNDFSS